MKHNPLFVDSTKFKGERINAEIEVRGVQLREGERLQTKVILSDGQQILIEMECFRPQRFSGAVRLKYLEEVRFQHQILSGDEIIDSTAEKKFVANYTVMDLWARRVEELKDQYIEELSFESLERELRASALRKMAGDEEDSDEMEVPQIKEKENKNPVKELEGYLDQIVQKEAKREEPEEKKEYGA
ncbi:MAG: hypothetical protein KDD25_03320, partial [Bdellovibrionales bacterium]|nr:hypothetical protein [Bdellovibrionales bacterium]